MEDGRTVVERYGQLQVTGTNLCDAQGNPVQLRGMSSHGLQWYGKYANRDVIRWLRDDWNCQIWRSAMYITQGGYASNASIAFKVDDSIEAAVAEGIYVIADWHVLSDRDPNAYADKAVEYFTLLAQKYGSTPNLIYEICNEPNGENVTWDGAIRPYAERVVSAIRAVDPDNIIIVGTPNWSQRPDLAAEHPLEGRNIMYTVHFYAGSHGKESRTRVEKALKSGLPVFATEWGTTKDSGDGGVFEDESKKWLSFMEKNNISWCNWSVNNKGEDSGILKYNADRNAEGGWKEEDLSPDGLFMRKVLRAGIR